MGPMNTIDLSYLEDMTGGDTEVVIEMIELFIEQTPEHIAAIKNAKYEQNWSQLRSEAHKVKPMFLYVGLLDLNEVCKDIEDSAKNEEDLDTLADKIEKLETGFNEVVEPLKQKISELS